MKLESKLSILDRIYKLYDEFAHGIQTACRKYCADCCTCNVTLTTLEGYYVLESLNPDRRRWLKAQFGRHRLGKRFQPVITTNELARRCINGEAIPEEAAETQGGPCPLLKEDLCPIYPLRPFGCRCFMSKQPCAKTGWADVDDYVVTVNTIFLQTLEHIDAGGCSGNLTDVLLCLSDEDKRRDYRMNRLECRREGLIENRPLSVLMVPPAQRARVMPIIETLRNLTP